MTTPFPKIIDHYSLTGTPWVRLEFADGRRESMAPAEALEHIRAAAIVAAHQPRPGAAERMEARHIEQEAPEFPDGEFGKPFQDDDPIIPAGAYEMSQSEINEHLTALREAHLFDPVNLVNGVPQVWRDPAGGAK